MRRTIMAFLPMAVLAALGGSLRGEEEGEKKEAVRGDNRSRPQPERMMKEWDKNGDGKLTLDEVPADRKEFFERVRNRADTDGDGALSLDELKKAFSISSGTERGEGEAARRGAGKEASPESPGKPGEASEGPAGFFRLLDADHDGKLTKEELAKAPDLIAKLDRDGDGALSPRELLGGGSRPEGSRPEGSRPEGARPEGARPEGRRPAGAPPAADRPLARLLSQMDKDGDGKISKDEATGRFKNRFAQLDANSDGYLDREELAKAVERFRERARERQGQGEGKTEPKPEDKSAGKGESQRPI